MRDAQTEAGDRALPRPKNPLWEVLLRSKPALFLVFFASLWMNLLLLVPPVFMMQVYDRILTSRSMTTLVLMGTMALALMVFYSILDTLRNDILVRIGVRIDADLHEKVFYAIFRRNLRRPDASRARALQEIATIRGFASGPAFVAFFDLPWVPLYILLCWAVHWSLALVAIVDAAILFLLTILTEMATRPALEKAALLANGANAFADASLRNSEVIEAMGMLPSLLRRWGVGYRQAIIMQTKASDRAAILSSMSRFVQQSSYIITLGIGALLVVEEQITPGLMIITTMVVARALVPINQIVSSWRSFVAARGAARRLTQLLEDFQPPRDNNVKLPATEGAIVAERLVVARNGGGPPILKGVSFDMPANTLLAIIGPSGSGKTTLVRAILGVTALAQGVVRLDGADIDTLDRAAIGGSIGYLPQDIELFNGTVAENIARFGVLDSPVIVEAAKAAGVHEMILGLTDGYETVIGEQGSVLSAGQRQRVALARALYGQPRLVVLDEPNSNLDAEGEQALLGALSGLKARGASVLVIAHRSSMLAGLDRILVLRDGVVAEYGLVSEMLPKMMRPVTVPANPQVKQA